MGARRSRRRIRISFGEFVAEEALSPLLLGQCVGDLPVAIIEEIEHKVVGSFHHFRVERQRLQEGQERSFVVHLWEEEEEEEEEEAEAGGGGGRGKGRGL